NALPNYIGDANILPMVDVSQSMGVSLGSGSTLAMDVALSLGLYCADKNKGKFNGTSLTFSSNPQLINLQGNIAQKLTQMATSDWKMSTDLEAAFRKILSVAKDSKVPAEEMPELLLIFSDMQFNACVSNGSQ